MQSKKNLTLESGQLALPVYRIIHMLAQPYEHKDETFKYEFS